MDIECELIATAAERDELRREIELIRASTLWRLTLKLRAVAASLPPSLRVRLKGGARLAWRVATPWRAPARARLHRERMAAAAAAGASVPSRKKASVRLDRSDDASYADWIRDYEPRQGRAEARGETAAGARVSLLIPPGDVAATRRTLASVDAQTSEAWEIVCVEEAVTADVDPRLKGAPGLQGLPKAAALAPMLGLATGDWVAVIEPGDLLVDDAVEDVLNLLAHAPGAAIVYSDEDEAQPNGVRLKPYFKPSWSPQLLQAFNYFGRLTVISRRLLLEVDGFLAGDGEGVEWSANLRAADAAIESGRTIERLTRVLCHRRAGGARERAAADTPAAADHRAVAVRYWSAKGVDATVSTQPDGTQHAVWPIAAPPLVSIIIPSHDHVDVLARCLTGLTRETDYEAIEIIVVENNSNAETLSFYDTLADDPRIRVVTRDGPFNYSRVCNWGAGFARGRLLLFLNNDIEVLTADWLSELVRVAMLPGVGVVGTQLRYPDGTLQHGGVAAGIHLFCLAYHDCDDHWGVFGAPSHARNWLAIMGACQMVRREVFDLVGGFDEAFQIANSDVALCLKAHLAGWRTAYTPFAALAHHEGETRGRTNPAADMARSGRLLESSLSSDPYLHPELSGLDVTMRLRGKGEPSLSDIMRSNLDLCLREGRQAWPPLDILDDFSVTQACDLPHEAVFWAPQDIRAIRDTRAAARWIIDLARRQPAVRLRFPQALAEGASGAFGRWIIEDGGAALGLDEAARRHVRDALAGDMEGGVLEDSVREALARRADMRVRHPLFLLPPGRRALVVWLFRNGRTKEALSLEAIWWFLIKLAETPRAQVAQTYLLTPDWQAAHPYGLTVFGREQLATWLVERYFLAADQDWLQAAAWPEALKPLDQLRLTYAQKPLWRLAHPRAFKSVPEARAALEWLARGDSGVSPDARSWCERRLEDDTATAMARPGVNLIGHFCYPSGLKVSLEALAAGVEALGVEVSRRNIRATGDDYPEHLRHTGLEVFDVTILHAQPEPFFLDGFKRADLAPRTPRPYRIAFWYWELETAPAHWSDIARMVDEVWVATRFVADALRPRCAVPVKTIFPGVQLGAFKRRPLSDFGVESSGRFTFLFSFHMASILERKNPLGLIAAFKAAFRPSEPVELILKTTFQAHHSEGLADLRAAARGANITILDQTLSGDETLSLMDACDAYVSLHRSEGLGLTMAEAMLLGKPVIATRYSGNLDFMDDQNSLLVDYVMTLVGPGKPPYDAEARWAEPSIDQAARAMRRLADDRDFARDLGARARRDAEVRLSVRTAGERALARLSEIDPADLSRSVDWRRFRS